MIIHYKIGYDYWLKHANTDLRGKEKQDLDNRET